MLHTNSDTSRRRKRLIVMITIAVVVLVAAVGVYGLFTSSDRHETNQPTKTATSPPGIAPTSTGPSASTASTPTSSATTSIRLPAPVVESSNPATFARSAAMVLFDWDTTVGYQPADIAQAVVVAGDPTGVETGLASDVRTYLPTNYDWNDLRTYQTKQWLTINRAYVPHGWAAAVAQAQPGQLRPGTVAYTIIGTRHRSGIWLTQPVSTTHPVAFTMIITCRPTFSTCKLLRIGKLNSPLK